MASEVTAITPKISLTRRSQEGTVDRNSARNRVEQTRTKKDKMMIEGIQHASSELRNHANSKVGDAGFEPAISSSLWRFTMFVAVPCCSCSTCKSP
jgi:hypothetical protein